MAYAHDGKWNAVVDADGRKAVNSVYYKLTVNFTVYDGDGNHAPQETVCPVYPNENSAFGSMAGLTERNLIEDQALTDKRADGRGARGDRGQLRSVGANGQSVRAQPVQQRAQPV